MAAALTGKSVAVEGGEPSLREGGTEVTDGPFRRERSAFGGASAVSRSIMYRDGKKGM